MKTNLLAEVQRLNRLISETDAAYHSCAVKLGLSDSALKILYAAYGCGGECMLLEICQWTGISKQTLSSSVAVLERRGVLSLGNGRKNKRLCLTDAGMELAERTAALVMAAENRVFAGWERADMEKYLELTERYLKDFQRETENL